jgi:hypothetical protein
MTERRNNCPLQLGVMILNTACYKGLANNGPKCSAGVVESGDMASSIHLVLESSATWRWENQNQRNASQVPNFRREGAGLRL